MVLSGRETLEKMGCSQGTDTRGLVFLIQLVWSRADAIRNVPFVHFALVASVI